jgi:hypothetical protein
MNCALLSAADTERLLTALHQGDDRLVARLLVELAGIARAGTYDVVVDLDTGMALITTREAGHEHDDRQRHAD